MNSMFLSKAFVDAYQKRELQTMQLRMMRPGYDPKGQDLDECLACARRGYPLPGEQGYAPSFIQSALEQFDRLELMVKQLSDFTRDKR